MKSGEKSDECGLFDVLPVLRQRGENKLQNDQSGQLSNIQLFARVYIEISLESLILAQDERWRRA